MMDRSARGRCNIKKGSLRKDAILNESQVLEIKIAARNRVYGFIRSTAKKYGVHENTIADIIHGRNWRQVEAP